MRVGFLKRITLGGIALFHCIGCVSLMKSDNPVLTVFGKIWQGVYTSPRGRFQLPIPGHSPIIKDGLYKVTFEDYTGTMKVQAIPLFRYSQEVATIGSDGVVKIFANVFKQKINANPGSEILLEKSEGPGMYGIYFYSGNPKKKESGVVSGSQNEKANREDPVQQLNEKLKMKPTEQVFGSLLFIKHSFLYIITKNSGLSGTVKPNDAILNIAAELKAYQQEGFFYPKHSEELLAYGEPEEEIEEIPEEEGGGGEGGVADAMSDIPFDFEGIINKIKPRLHIPHGRFFFDKNRFFKWNRELGKVFSFNGKKVDVRPSNFFIPKNKMFVTPGRLSIPSGRTNFSPGRTNFSPGRTNFSPSRTKFSAPRIRFK